MKVGPIKPRGLRSPMYAVRHRRTGQLAIGLLAPGGRELYVQFSDLSHPKSHGWWPMPKSQFDRVGPTRSWSTQVRSARLVSVAPARNPGPDDLGNGGPMHHAFLFTGPKRANY